ncbi:glycosyltransferase [Bradyrhizobium sp. RT3b]|uniref:glycosyltransferase family 2 protein n=1 Tax=Bradyrhizobium sp. RT3b TaxID=3156334 RepID=UPI00339AF0A7
MTGAFHKQAGELKLSIVILNYNYADYVGAAIQSALDVRWPNMEVVVVDDGSTDDSPKVIEAFGDRIKLISQPNAGQKQASINGFRRSSGDLIIFLDSDDALHPDVMTEIAKVWSASASKFQFQMRTVDADGKPKGTILPQYFVVPTSKDIRNWMTTTGAYPTPPGSGNAYPRWVVEKVFDFKTDFVHRAPDSYLLAASAAFGEIVTIPKPLADYRVHGQNHGAFSQVEETRFAREVELTRGRYEYFCKVAASNGIHAAPDALSRNMAFVCLRAASYVLRPDLHPIEGDRRWRIAWDGARSVFYPQGFSRAQRVSLAAFTFGILFGPPSVSRSLAGWRYASTNRPPWVKKVLNLMRIVR